MIFILMRRPCELRIRPGNGPKNRLRASSPESGGSNSSEKQMPATQTIDEFLGEPPTIDEFLGTSRAEQEAELRSDTGPVPGPLFGVPRSAEERAAQSFYTEKQFAP